MKAGDRVRLLDKCATAVRTIEAVEREGGVLLVSWRDGGGKLRRKRVWATDVVLASRTLRVDDPRITELRGMIDDYRDIVRQRDELMQERDSARHTSCALARGLEAQGREIVSLVGRMRRRVRFVAVAAGMFGVMLAAGIALGLRVAGVL